MEGSIQDSKPMTTIELLQKLECIIDKRILANRTVTRKLSDMDKRPTALTYQLNQRPKKIGA